MVPAVLTRLRGRGQSRGRNPDLVHRLVGIATVIGITLQIPRRRPNRVSVARKDVVTAHRASMKMKTRLRTRTLEPAATAKSAPEIHLLTHRDTAADGTVIRTGTGLRGLTVTVVVNTVVTDTDPGLRRRMTAMMRSALRMVRMPVAKPVAAESVTSTASARRSATVTTTAKTEKENATVIATGTEIGRGKRSAPLAGTGPAPHRTITPTTIGTTVHHAAVVRRKRSGKRKETVRLVEKRVRPRLKKASSRFKAAPNRSWQMRRLTRPRCRLRPKVCLILEHPRLRRRPRARRRLEPVTAIAIVKEKRTRSGRARLGATACRSRQRRTGLPKAPTRTRSSARHATASACSRKRSAGRLFKILRLAVVRKESADTMDTRMISRLPHQRVPAQSASGTAAARDAEAAKPRPAAAAAGKIAATVAGRGG